MTNTQLDAPFSDTEIDGHVAALDMLLQSGQISQRFYDALFYGLELVREDEATQRKWAAREIAASRETQDAS